MDYEFWIEDYVAGGLPTAFNCSCTPTFQSEQGVYSAREL